MDADASRAERHRLLGDELFATGSRCDTVFLCSGEGGAPTPIYGHAALFGLISPRLQRLLEGDAPGRRTVPLYDLPITWRAFREVTRYVYALPPGVVPELLPELLAAARLLEMPELHASSLSWGLERIADMDVDSALRCLEELCGTPSAWCSALLRAFPASEVLGSAAILALSPMALQELIEAEVFQSEPVAVWDVALAWARARAVPEPPKQPAPPPLRPFARQLLPLEPPVLGAVEWQRCLLPKAKRIHFAAMTATEFAQVEALDPMLPELRQAIYATRRRHLQAMSTATR